MKLPAFQFYPGDWLKDPNLRRCSHAARGVWIDLLCVAFECEERGVLATAGIAWSDDEIAQAIGGDRAVALSCLRELLDKGVASRNQSGCVYSRRLVRDECNRKTDKERKRRSRSRHGPVTPLSEEEVEDEVLRFPRGEGAGGGEARTNLVKIRSELCELFKRDHSETWGYVEEHALAQVSRRSHAISELEELKTFKLKGDFFPQSIDSLLSGWTKTLDRARNPNENGTANQRNHTQRPDRNKGTLNEGLAEQYDLSKIQASRRV